MAPHPAVAVSIGLMWLFFLITWTVPSIRRKEPHEVSESLGLATMLTMTILLISGTWQLAASVALRIGGLLLLAVATIAVLPAFHSLRTRGKPADAWEKTTVLVDSSVYGRVRHPMYLGTGMIAVALALLAPSTGSVSLAAACVVATLLASLKEDNYNLRKFGEPYADYMRHVPLVNICQRRSRHDSEHR